MTEQQLIQVKCYSGYMYAQRPQSFLFEDREHTVSRMEKVWIEPDKRFFSVITEDEKRFKLCYNETQDQWWLIHS